ncbi:hypothetical protein COO60DRAFT_1529763 [Scenedesmus sp. NREL 46B-D3]|nr:hypothetical protein COO60DRAFT_1529763 [Scenedesmus sp. NREL 46B-D3]
MCSQHCGSPRQSYMPQLEVIAWCAVHVLVVACLQRISAACWTACCADRVKLSGNYLLYCVQRGDHRKWGLRLFWRHLPRVLEFQAELTLT